MRLHMVAAATFVASVSSAAVAAAADLPAALTGECAACHALEKPAEPSLQRLWDRKGPDLWYAGVKFNRDWLVAWLQKPTPIRPGGVLWGHHAKPGEPRDTIDAAAVPPHPALDEAKAKEAAEALMALKPDGLVEAGAFKGGDVNLRMGQLSFGKLRGCSSCHQDKAGEGGLSGPELFDAGGRLQPDYVLSYMKDPQKFDRFVWMPRLPLSDQDLQRLTGYVAKLGKEEKP